MRLSPLTNQKNISAEMRRIYRDARTNKIPITDGRELMRMLKLISEQMQSTDLEERISALERQQGE